ncbi:MAG: hypothetical protein MUO26_10500 [Methanotrichaceae archaeon]|nr:hypothetical protein [Methanotrichaceae archaeon]
MDANLTHVIPNLVGILAQPWWRYWLPMVIPIVLIVVVLISQCIWERNWPYLFISIGFIIILLEGCFIYRLPIEEEYAKPEYLMVGAFGVLCLCYGLIPLYNQFWLSNESDVTTKPPEESVAIRVRKGSAMWFDLLKWILILATIYFIADNVREDLFHLLRNILYISYIIIFVYLFTYILDIGAFGLRVCKPLKLKYPYDMVIGLVLVILGVVFLWFVANTIVENMPSFNQQLPELKQFISDFHNFAQNNCTQNSLRNCFPPPKS